MKPILRLLWMALLGGAAWAAPPEGVAVVAPPHDSGVNLVVSWTGAPGLAHAILRAEAAEGPWALVGEAAPGTGELRDTVTNNARQNPPKDAYFYKVVSLGPDAPPRPIAEEGEPSAEALAAWATALASSSEASAPVEGRPDAALLNTGWGHLLLLAIIIAVGALMLTFAAQARKGKELFIRRIPGIDAIEEGIGRSTEMGKPVLYVPGIGELQEIQTIASMLILGQVAKKIAEYQADVIVSCCIPIVREVADEVVKAGFFQAGYPDAYNPANTRFISSDQFAFTAGTNGIILREKPATNLYLGMFFAESLILAETGFLNRSIQIGGTAEATQLPFFVAACDYTLIGEELYATSAYLSRDPRLTSSLKASDYIKLFCVAMLLLGTVLHSMGNDIVLQLFTIAE